MTIRCPECGYENRDMYRFCGMCGATLRREAAADEPQAPRIMPADEPPRPSAAPARPSSAPAVPGFITEGSAPRSLDYLLEDEPKKSRAKLVVTLALLLIAAGLVAWHWQRDGYPWANNASSTLTANSSSAPGPTENAAAAPPPTAQPAPTPQAKPAPPKPTPPPPKEEEAPQKQATNENPPTDQPEAAPDKTSPNDAPSDDNPAKDASTTADASQPAAAVAPPPPAPKSAPQPKPAPSLAPVLKGDDKLVADGEKYLYGTGVAENCDLAQKNLRTAANHSNARALTLMGAMYATGHCVNRDLPTAYRWFAKALHQDPSNSRVQQDLEILWKQMTPEERQLATKAGG